MPAVDISASVAGMSKVIHIPQMCTSLPQCFVFVQYLEFIYTSCYSNSDTDSGYYYYIMRYIMVASA